jgi:hypothetical protein
MKKEKLEEIHEKYKISKLKQLNEKNQKTRTGFQPRNTMGKNKQGEYGFISTSLMQIV